MALLLALALAAQPPAAGTLVTRHADGSATLERRIEAEPPPPATPAHRLGESGGKREAKRDRERDDAFEADLREAFEEALDQARTSLPE